MCIPGADKRQCTQANFPHVRLSQDKKFSEPDQQYFHTVLQIASGHANAATKE